MFFNEIKNYRFPLWLTVFLLLLISIPFFIFQENYALAKVLGIVLVLSITIALRYWFAVAKNRNNVVSRVILNRNDLFDLERDFKPFVNYSKESKKVIIATYAMASEGLDIKTLTTLIMASPKTDVCQSVGRILRTKHTSPLVIDIIDSHDIFEKQWLKRRQYYIKQKYNIISSNNDDYYNNKWETLYDPKDNEKSIKKIKKKDEPLKGVCLLNI